MDDTTIHHQLDHQETYRVLECKYADRSCTTHFTHMTAFTDLSHLHLLPRRQLFIELYWPHHFVLTQPLGLIEHSLVAFCVRVTLTPCPIYASLASPR